MAPEVWEGELKEGQQGTRWQEVHQANNLEFNLHVRSDQDVLSFHCVCVWLCVLWNVAFENQSSQVDSFTHEVVRCPSVVTKRKKYTQVSKTLIMEGIKKMKHPNNSLNINLK